MYQLCGLDKDQPVLTVNFSSNTIPTPLSSRRLGEGALRDDPKRQLRRRLYDLYELVSIVLFPDEYVTKLNHLFEQSHDLISIRFWRNFRFLYAASNSALKASHTHWDYWHISGDVDLHIILFNFHFGTMPGSPTHRCGLYPVFHVQIGMTIPIVNSSRF